MCNGRWVGRLAGNLLAAILLVTLPVNNVFAQETSSATNEVESPVGLETILDGGAPSSLDELRAMEQLTQKILDDVTPCTVGLRIGQAQGSGVLISRDGYILTAAHVIQRPGLRADIILHDGRIVRGKTLGLDRSTDAGLVQINPPDDDEPAHDWPHLEMGKSSDLKPGQWCLVLGHPGGYQPGRKPVLRFGRVLTIEDGLIVTDCTLVGGDSGGPLVDMTGRVIGIHSRIGGPITANMHVPVKTYRDSWDRLVKGEMWGEVPRGAPYIGVQGDSESEQAKIVRVEPGQPADRAGLKPGDVVLKFGGREVTNFASLAGHVADAEPGDKFDLLVQRGDEIVTLELTIGRRR